MINSWAVILPLTFTSPIKLDSPVINKFEPVISPLELTLPFICKIGSSSVEPLMVVVPIKVVSSDVMSVVVSWWKIEAVIVPTSRLFKFLILNVVSSDALIS